MIEPVDEIKGVSKNTAPSFDEHITYYINEEDKSVTAVAVVSVFEAFGNNIDLLMRAAYAGVKGKEVVDMYENKKFIGIARCKDSDKWDIERGKRVARLKLIKSLVRYRRKLLEEAYDFLESTLDAVRDDLDKHITCEDKLVQYIRRG